MLNKVTHFSFFLIMLFFNFNTYGKNLIVNGLNTLKLENIESITQIDLNKSNYSEIDINTLINELYDSDLIYDLKLKENNESYLLEIIENKIINEIYFLNNTIIKDDQILSVIQSKKDTLQSKKLIARDIEIINSIYKSKGYIDIFTTAKVERFSENRVNLIFELNEGKQYKVNKIDFKGNYFFSDRFLSSLISSKSVNFYNILSSGSNIRPEVFEFDRNQILQFYKGQGFFDIKISYSLESNNLGIYSLIFYISEGEKHTISKINYDTDLLKFKFIEDSKNNFENKLGKRNFFYEESLINQHLEDINNFLINQNISNFYVDLKISNIEKSIFLDFIKVNQKPSVVNKINIYGNSITKDKTIRNKISFEPGDIFKNYLIERNIKRLNSLPYIQKASYEDPLKNDNNLNILIEENTKTGQILAAGTYDTDTEFGITFGIEDKNFAGSGNTVDLNFSLNSENLRYDLNYIQYPIFNPNLSNAYSLFNQEIDYTSSFGYKSSKKGIGYNLNFSENFKVSYDFGISYQNTEGHSAKNTSEQSITDSIGNFNDLILSFSIKNDSTNDIFNPNSGFYNKLNFSLSPENISDDPYYKLNYINKNYFKLRYSNNYFFFNNNVGYARSLKTKLKTINAFSLGGGNFKGFDYRGIGQKSNGVYLGGNSVVTSTIGYGSSFLFDEKDNVNIKLFLTSGSLWDSDYTTDSKFKLRSSAGISLDFITAIGPISFSYAVPINKELNDNPRNFSFQIGSSF